MKRILLFLFLLPVLGLSGQAPVKIALLHDFAAGAEGLGDFGKLTKTEILQLLQHRRDIEFIDYYGAYESDRIAQNIEKAYEENDIVVGLGLLSGTALTRRINFPKPTIIGILADAGLSGLVKSSIGTSTIANLTYIESPFNISRDLQTLHEIRPYNELALVIDDNLAFQGDLLLKEVVRKNLEVDSVEINVYSARSLLSGSSKLKTGTDAVYALPILLEDSTKLSELFRMLNAEKIPTAALLGDEFVEAGALMGYEGEKHLNLIPRRIALNIMKIIEGIKPEEIPVGITTYDENLLINMATARQIKVYPNFEIIASATLLHLLDENTDRELSLQAVIAEALQSNLDRQLAALDVHIADKEIGIAKSDLLPQVDVTTALSMVDENTALTYQGFQGATNWTGSANFTQIIYAEPILANLAIQKLLKQGEEYELNQVQLDMIIDVSEAYLNILQAQTNLSVQQKNVEVTKENFNIATSKNAIGYTGASDLHRWEAELATKNIDLNSAVASVQQAKFRLNQLLNRPINEPFNVKNETLEDQMLLITDGRLEGINDYGKIEKFTNFLVDYAKDRLPTLNIIENSIKVQERLRLSRKRSFFLPTVSMNGGVNHLIGKYSVPEVFGKTENATTWNMAVGVNYPIFQGNLRRQQLDQADIQLKQLGLTQRNVENQLELAIRANMQQIYVSFSRMQLSQEASIAADQNFTIIQDAYNQGQVNITTLIDAQNNTLQAELGATNAVYTFILDFLELERSIGFFYFLASPEERSDFFQRATTLFINK
ncbi:MAG: TolC family protein [Saprospiraceae bacterium]|nr:TolC family protein [Saprospiraceae bacterium]